MGRARHQSSWGRGPGPGGRMPGVSGLPQALAPTPVHSLSVSGRKTQLDPMYSAVAPKVRGSPPGTLPAPPAPPPHDTRDLVVYSRATAKNVPAPPLRSWDRPPGARRLASNPRALGPGRAPPDASGGRSPEPARRSGATSRELIPVCAVHRRPRGAPCAGRGPQERRRR